MVPDHDENRKLQAHLTRERQAIFSFLASPGVPATNWMAEQAVRPAVVNRKTWGGNRTWTGSDTQQVLMTVMVTAAQGGHNAVEVLTGLLRGPPRSLAAFALPGPAPP